VGKVSTCYSRTVGVADRLAGEMGERVLFVHDVHSVIGEREFEFEDAVRDGYASAIADDDTRLLWYLYATHGAGDAYHTVIVTAVRDGAAWERLVQRLRYGDLSEWATQVDAMTYASYSSLLVSTDWSPLSDLDLDAIPAGPADTDVVAFREDTLEGPAIDTALAPGHVEGGSDDILSCVAAFRPALLAGGMARVLYRVAPPERWAPAFGADTGWADWSGSLTPTLPDGVHASSRYLRNVSWSPMS
jgi:hypothetical protein